MSLTGFLCISVIMFGCDVDDNSLRSPEENIAERNARNIEQYDIQEKEDVLVSEPSSYVKPSPQGNWLVKWQATITNESGNERSI